MTPQEWLRKNPHKTLNDYYNEVSQSLTPIKNEPIRHVIRERIVYIKKENNSLRNLAAFICIITFFLPWISTSFSSLLEVKKTGFYIVSNYKEMGLGKYPLYTLWLIPIGGILTIISSIGRFWLLRTVSVLGIISGLVTYHTIIYILRESVSQRINNTLSFVDTSHIQLHLVNSFEWGMLLLIGACFVLFVDLFR